MSLTERIAERSMEQKKLSFQTYHMEGGNGPCSYWQNSKTQKQALDSAKELMDELIDQHLDLGNPYILNPSSCFRIADFGCSVGPNTINAVQNIIDAVESKYKSTGLGTQIPEFHVFFNDHVDNDFNTLFKNLPANPGYFAAGVPGSFHRRLFPSSTLHFAHCSTAVHWISKIPQEVTDESSPAWNKGRIHYTGAAKEVKEAYSNQYSKDLDCFLNARARELVPGGLMILIVVGLADGVEDLESSLGETFNIIDSCFEEMTKEAAIPEELVDAFNLPFYYPSASELEALVDKNASFDILRMENLSMPIKQGKPDPRLLVLQIRPILGVLIKENFGEQIVEEFFERLLEKYVENPIVPDEKYYFVFLKRKMTQKD